MAGKRDKPLVRKGKPGQNPEKGLGILVPKRRGFFGALDEAAKKPSLG